VIDFRYHLVSLISVFLALAVGIILGAGPLQGAIGDQLTDQVDALREERNMLREDLGVAQTDVEQQLEFLQAAGPQLVAGSLEGQRVAVVDLDDVPGDVQQGVVDMLEAAGATVVTSTVLTPSWTAADDANFRDNLAPGLREQLDDVAADAGTDETLATALSVALTGASPVNPESRSEQATELEQLLVRAELVEVEGEQTQPADAVLLLSGAQAAAPSGDGDAGDGPSPEEAEVAILATLARTAQQLAPAAVVAGPTAVGGDLVSRVRGDEEIAAQVSTVSGTEKLAGRIVVPLAIAARIAGEVDQYGFEEGATVLPQTVDLPSSVDGAGDVEGAGEGQG
jgi:Copper transport outer membrane protein, MctB